jgi:hypothetical protein
LVERGPRGLSAYKGIIKTLLRVRSFVVFFAFSAGTASAQLLPPSVSTPITINGDELSGRFSLDHLRKLLHDDRGQPIAMFRGDVKVPVTNCAEWLAYTARNYQIVGDSGSGNYQYDITCTPLLFLEYAKIGKDDLNPKHPLNLKNAELIPANILPTEQTFVDEYTGYRNNKTSMGMLAASGDIQFSSEQDTASSPSVLVTCADDPECQTLSETLAEVARGDFLHNGSRQILVRADNHNPAGDGTYGNGSWFLLFSRTNGTTPYKAFVFDLDCTSSAMEKLSGQEPVPCVTTWPQILPAT